MALNTKKLPKGEARNNNTPPLESGNYPARVVQVIDLGMQEQRPFQGTQKPPRHEIMVTYELGTEFLLDENGEEQKDKPRWISESFPIHRMEAELAKSTKRMKAIDPKGTADGDFSRIVNYPCTVTVVTAPSKKDPSKIYSNVGGVTPPMKGFPVPELVNDTKVFDLDEPDMETFAKLPEWLQDKIKNNLTFNGSPLQAALGGKSAAAPEPEAEEEDDSDNPY